MFGTVTRTNTTIAIITKVGHGLTIPVGDKLMGIYVDSVTGDLLPADATDSNKQKSLFVTEIIDVDTIRAQTTGFLTSTAHGYTVGEFYFITDTGNGGFSTTPGTLNDIGFLVLNADVLVLMNNREL